MNIFGEEDVVKKKVRNTKRKSDTPPKNIKEKIIDKTTVNTSRMMQVIIQSDLKSDAAEIKIDKVKSEKDFLKPSINYIGDDNND
jgi:hypothetical protein